MIASNKSIEIFSTCPPSSDLSPDGQIDQRRYLQRVTDVAQWSEEAGCQGILVYSDNRLVDPWLVSQVIIQHTRALCPLVALQPLYMHPYAAAKMIASLAFMYGRRVYLNMIAGGFKNDLTALNDTTGHDKRYDRLVEYTHIVKELLATTGPVSFAGAFYQVKNLRLKPAVPADLVPGIFISGSSAAGLAAARTLGATAIQYPRPQGEYDAPGQCLSAGIRIGIIAREQPNLAWQVAHARFPDDRKGQVTHQLAMHASDSQWHKQLAELAQKTAAEATPYWLHPFQNYKTFCPYLVGDYRQVAAEVAGYITAGFGTFILDIPTDRDELRHIDRVFSELSDRQALQS